MPVAFLASIPSPHSGTIDVGPFSIHLYGVMLLLAIAACVALTGYRWVKWGGDWDLVFRVAVWGVAFGIVGARLYHDITSWSEVKAIDAWWAPFAVWKGGLGVWGGILFGVLAGAWIVHRSGNSVRLFMDAVAPGLLLAQGIGRWGNWFNQELYGKPTSLPWGLKIDEAHRGAYIQYTTFHPTFLYEFIWDIVGVVILLLVDRMFRIRRPALFALYVSFYCFGRFFEELLRIDPAHKYYGLRLNAYVSIVVFVLSTAFFIWWQFIRRETPADRPRAKRIVPEGPAMAVPKGRVRSGR
ncbi:MAG: prolipoprotein diacylglyceryl transferase [Actinobacteria bacterium]|nr:MAG: prolipoprotein diacylglyceryl transferase [Actinomycetota bacterium]